MTHVVNVWHIVILGVIAFILYRFGKIWPHGGSGPGGNFHA
jgi:hypothetical protein